MNNRLLFLVSFLSLSFNINYAQSGLKVKYTETIAFEIPEEVKAMNRDMPSSGEFDKILLVNGDESTYQTNKEDVKEEGPQRDGRRMFRGRNVDAILYKNNDEETQLEFKDVFGKEFLVTSEYKTYPWKIIAAEQRDILGYTCMKATYQDTADVVVAWFTTQIPHSVGPGGFHGLPGLILAVSEGEKRVILAKSVEDKMEDVTIIKPEKGEKVTEEEFKKIAAEKRKEMEKMWGGNRKRMNRQ